MEFLLNIRNNKIHNAASTDKRCRLNMIGNGNKKIFSTYQEAREYSPRGNQFPKPCSFCLGPNYEEFTDQGETK